MIWTTTFKCQLNFFILIWETENKNRSTSMSKGSKMPSNRR